MLEVGNVHRRRLQDRPSGQPVACRRLGGDSPVEALHPLVGPGAREGDPSQRAILELPDDAVQSAAQPHGALHDRFEDGLHVGPGAADDAQDLRGARLSIERLAQIPVARPQLREQADVLDGDDRLVGEGFKQLNLPVRKRAHLGAARVQ